MTVYANCFGFTEDDSSVLFEGSCADFVRNQVSFPPIKGIPDNRTIGDSTCYDED